MITTTSSASAVHIYTPSISHFDNSVCWLWVHFWSKMGPFFGHLCRNTKKDWKHLKETHVSFDSFKSTFQSPSKLRDYRGIPNCMVLTSPWETNGEKWLKMYMGLHHPQIDFTTSYSVLLCSCSKNCFWWVISHLDFWYSFTIRFFWHFDPRLRRQTNKGSSHCKA